jgi:hypothetical protein
MAELAEQKVHFGRGPSTADVICVAIGSGVSYELRASFSGRRGHTREDGREEVLGHRRGILLDVSLVVVEGPVVAASLKRLGILHHLVVQQIEVFMGNDVFDDD